MCDRLRMERSRASRIDLFQNNVFEILNDFCQKFESRLRWIFSYTKPWVSAFSHPKGAEMKNSFFAISHLDAKNVQFAFNHLLFTPNSSCSKFSKRVFIVLFYLTATCCTLCFVSLAVLYIHFTFVLYLHTNRLYRQLVQVRRDKKHTKYIYSISVLNPRNVKVFIAACNQRKNEPKV